MADKRNNEGNETALPKRLFEEIGKEISKIEVRISYKIIELFSEGLYSNPHKAVEELVVNAFDAEATKVNVVFPEDLGGAHATITVIDNGTGMNAKGLEELWQIGVSNKREEERKGKLSRKQIGKFGIGKLATYVLADRLTHICKNDSEFWATSMDFAEIPESKDGTVATEKPVRLPLRKLTEEEAKKALDLWLKRKKPGFTKIKLFGTGAEKSWTVAIMSNLKDMALGIYEGRMKRILATAMPLRPDFELYLNGDLITPSKLKAEKIGKWVIGKDLVEITKPAPDDLRQSIDRTARETSDFYYGVENERLGRITGFAEIYEDLLTTGKPSKIERSHGFFVYVRGRLINLNDEYFGIDSNLLKHGVFSRFRMVVNVDSLDDELRSSRESVREGGLLEEVRNFLRGVFNFVRPIYEQHEDAKEAGLYAVKRLADTPSSLTQRPILRMLRAAFEGGREPRYLLYPKGLKAKEIEEFLKDTENRIKEAEGLIREIRLVDDLTQSEGLAIFDIKTGLLKINRLHPFVAFFLDDFEDEKRNVPLELLAVSEVILEAHLFEIGFKNSYIDDLLGRRDEMFRYLARSTGRRNALVIAQDLQNASNNKDELEKELVAAFNSMGFKAVPLGGKGKPDGFAEAFLSAGEDVGPRSYKLTLEAKSKKKPGKKVTAKAVAVATVARQRDEYGCDYAVVVGPDFPTTRGETSALAKEIEKDKENNLGKSITLIRVVDLARLVRLVPAKRVGLDELQGLFREGGIPEKSKDWIDGIDRRRAKKPPSKPLLSAIWDLQKDIPDQTVEYANVDTYLRYKKKLTIGKSKIIELCKALSQIAPEYVSARENIVELKQPPEIIIRAITATIAEYPEEEQERIKV